jgi:hypothetical protein
MEKLLAFVLETYGLLHARGQLLLWKIARLQAEYADERRRAAKYPSYASLGVRTPDAAADRLVTLMLRYLQDCPPRF